MSGLGVRGAPTHGLEAPQCGHAFWGLVLLQGWRDGPGARVHDPLPVPRPARTRQFSHASGLCPGLQL